MTTTPVRRTRSDGERTRRTILLAATRLATVEGLEGLSIGRLAAETGMSKSGLFAHFGSKEELQLATIALAEEIFQDEVMTPALAGEGVARVRALSEGFITHIDRQVFPGGCFFASAAAEMDTRPGRVRDRVLMTLELWSGLFVEALEVARARGEIAESSDPAQIAFEINAVLAQANGLFLLREDARVFDMARRAIADRLERAAT